MVPETTPEKTEIIVPLLSEELSVQKRSVRTGGVRVHVQTSERNETVREPLLRQKVEVERTPIGRIVEVAPPVRSEGDTTIISIVEEVLVVEKRLLLKEEIKITKIYGSEDHVETLTLREQSAAVERLTPERPE